MALSQALVVWCITFDAIKYFRIIAEQLAIRAEERDGRWTGRERQADAMPVVLPGVWARSTLNCLEGSKKYLLPQFQLCD